MNSKAPPPSKSSFEYGARSVPEVVGPAWLLWQEHKLQDFDGDRQAAADASVRLACIHAGVLAGESTLTFDSLCNGSFWHLTPGEPANSLQDRTPLQ